jgi:hypothetical protein
MSVVGNWTYSGDPRDSDRDAVRFLIGDTNESDQLVSDEEIAYMLLSMSVYRAAALAATGISKAFAGKASSKTVGSLSLKNGFEKKADSYKDLAARLDGMANKGALTSFVAYAGGISSADKQANEYDSDWEKPSFYRGIHDNPGALTPFRGDPTSSTEEYR